MFKFLEESVGNAVDVALGVVSLGEAGELSKSTVSNLIADGLTVAAIAEGFGVAEDVIEGFVGEDE